MKDTPMPDAFLTLTEAESGKRITELDLVEMLDEADVILLHGVDPHAQRLVVNALLLRSKLPVADLFGVRALIDTLQDLPTTGALGMSSVEMLDSLLQLPGRGAPDAVPKIGPRQRMPLTHYLPDLGGALAKQFDAVSQEYLALMLKDPVAHKLVGESGSADDDALLRWMRDLCKNKGTGPRLRGDLLGALMLKRVAQVHVEHRVQEGHIAVQVKVRQDLAELTKHTPPRGTHSNVDAGNVIAFPASHPDHDRPEEP